MRRILFVCTGNTCRSSMAEVIFKDMIKDKELDIEVHSRGVSAVDGHRASKQAVQVMREDDIDLSKHRSKLLTEKDVKKADLILTMTTNHKSLVLNLYPEAQDKIYTLKEYAHKDIDIDDILDEINETYKKINEKREKLMLEREGEIKALKKKRVRLLKEIKSIDKQLKEWEMDIESELEDEKAHIIKLQKKIPSLDIKDPFGQPVEVYRDSAKDIKEALRKIIKDFDKNKGGLK